jgi:hypothetical protein
MFRGWLSRSSLKLARVHYQYALQAEAKENSVEPDKCLKRALTAYNDYVATKPDSQLTDDERMLRRALDDTFLPKRPRASAQIHTAGRSTSQAGGTWREIPSQVPD